MACCATIHILLSGFIQFHFAILLFYEREYLKKKKKAVPFVPSPYYLENIFIKALKGI